MHTNCLHACWSYLSGWLLAKHNSSALLSILQSPGSQEEKRYSFIIMVKDFKLQELCNKIFEHSPAPFPAHNACRDFLLCGLTYLPAQALPFEGNSP